MERSELEPDSGNGHDIKDMATEKFDRAREWSGEALERVESFVRQRPGTAMLVAIGAGFVIGRLVRRS